MIAAPMIIDAISMALEGSVIPRMHIAGRGGVGADVDLDLPDPAL
ncbi:hypothetical protein [Microbacterium maritypicum]